MKVKSLKIIQLCLCLIGCHLIFTAVSCKKEDPFPIHGKWETINAVGFKWDYDIQKNGQACKALEEYFPGTSFCFDYRISADTLFIYGQSPEVWIWEFECEDVAVVTATVGPENEVSKFVLSRK